MMFWKSIVGKLWGTILFLVSFILFILTLLLLEYFDNYNLNLAENQLKNETNKIVEIMKNETDIDSMYHVFETMVGRDAGVLFYFDDTQSTHLIHDNRIPDLTSIDVRSNYDLTHLLKNGITVSQKVNVKETNGTSEILVIGSSFKTKDGRTGAVYVYEPLLLITQTGNDTAKFIVVIALLAIFLTTVFAFFLSTRITSPLRSMREAVFEVARGKFDTKVPILTHDEIGELAIAFNQMARQLKFNVNALRNEKEQLKGILNSMADGVFIISREGDLTALNPPADKFMQQWYVEHGFRNDDYQDMPYEFRELFEAVVENECEKVIEISFQDYVWVVIMTPLYSNVHVRGVVAITRDMTEERRLEKLRKDFIANVSHELRTPIAMLQGYSEAIVDDVVESEDEKKELARIIYDESLRMGRLVNDLLDLARMEAGHIQLNETNVPLQAFFEKITRKFQGLANDKQVKMFLDCNLQNDEFVLDEDRMEQVLTNLIDNAIRHTPEDGSVILKVTLELDGLFMQVKDTGYGIPAEDVPFVFERFYKADKARTRGKSGTGLGLSIAKNIVHAHKGNISVTSVINEGTTFSVFIPKNY